MSELKAQDCELEYWNQQAEDYALVQIPCEDLRAIISRAWEAPAFNSALSAAEARAEVAEARVRELSEALKPFAVIVSNHPEMDSASSVITLTYNKAHLRNAARTLKGDTNGR